MSLLSSEIDALISREDLISKGEIVEGYKRFVLIPEIEQMMFVAGETGEPSSETTLLIEQIVHEQVIEIVSLSIHICLRG